MIKFSDIKNRNDFADFLGIKKQLLTYVLYKRKVKNLYTCFTIAKKNGGERNICAPVVGLKGIQKKLSWRLLEHQSNTYRENEITNSISHGFEKGKDIITNAKIHRNKKYVLNVDLEDFFGSFHFGRVRGFFEKNKNFMLPIEIATIIAQIACYNGCLPQGAPSSPIITNLICNIFDIRILKLAKKYKLNYTRYADDLTFSTNNKDFIKDQEKFYKSLCVEVENAGFKVNVKKNRLQYQSLRQEVTGLVVNKKINVTSEFYKKTRAMAHHLYTQGGFFINGGDGSINQLEGRFAFVNHLTKYNNLIDNKKHNYHQLDAREKQYQRFLFYKYLFANTRPLIITEGKTDIIYLKAALKNLYVNYPNLIKKNKDGSFEFKITFLRKSKRLRYFFNLVPDGGDTMVNIMALFNNHLEYFIKKCCQKPKNPVFLIFDNETIKDKPLRKFIKKYNLEGKKVELAGNLNVNIDKNLYLVTNPLMQGKEECEIEDLFKEDVLSHTEGGKLFSRKKNYDIHVCYGKEIFSKYISKDYEKIDFHNFKPMLDKINLIVENYVQ